MERVTSSSVSDLDALVPSWRLSLEAENKSPATVTAYGFATTQFSAYLRAQGMPTDVTAITREHVEAFLRDLSVPPDAIARPRELRERSERPGRDDGGRRIAPRLEDPADLATA